MGQQNFPKFFAFFSSTMSLEGKLRQNLLLICFNNRENKISSVTVFCYYSVTQSCPTFVTPWTTARLPFSISQSLLRLVFTESVMPSKPLVLCRPFSSCPQSLPTMFQFCNILGCLLSAGYSLGMYKFSNFQRDCFEEFSSLGRLNV